MQTPSTHTRPELKVFGDNVAFLFPRPEERPADRVYYELLKAFAYIVPNIALAVAFFVVVPRMMADQILLANFPELWIVIPAMGGFFVLFSVLAIARAVLFFRRRHYRINEALDVLLTEIGVEDGRLVRRYASGREEIWPGEEIYDVIVERRVEDVPRGEDDSEKVPYSVLCIWLRIGTHLHLYGKAAIGSHQDEDLNWMANELRQSLHLPSGDSPAQIEGARVEKTDGGIIFHLPHKNPEALWRANIIGMALMGGMVAGFLFFSAGLVTVADMNDKGRDAIRWDAVLTISIVGASIGGLCLIGVLINLIGKAWIIRGYADETLIALGVRPGTLFRRFLSGREQTYPTSEISGVSLDLMNGSEKVQLHLKIGVALHLYGKHVVRDEEPQIREGLVWLAEQLSAALAPPTLEAEPTTEKPSEAIVDRTSPKPDSEAYR